MCIPLFSVQGLLVMLTSVPRYAKIILTQLAQDLRILKHCDDQRYALVN